MNVAGDGDYNLKLLNDAFEGKTHENEEIDIINVNGEIEIKTRTKRPPVAAAALKPPKTTAPSAAFAEPVNKQLEETKNKKRGASKKKKRDPRVDSIVDDVMRRSAAGFGKGIDADEAYEQDDDQSMKTADNYSMALVPVDEAEMKRKRNEKLKAQAKRVAATTQVGKVLFDIDEEGTFVTGVGIPGQSKNKPPRPEINRDDLFMSEEDKLLRQVD